MANLGQTFREYIFQQTTKTRSILGVVIAQDTNQTKTNALGVVEENPYFGTWTIQPIDNEPPLFNVMTFQKDQNGNKPEIDSFVVVQFFDEQNAYITDIIEYDTFTRTANEIRVIAAKLIELKSTEKMTLESGTDTTIDSQQNIKITATQGLDLTGNGVAITSNGVALANILTDILGALTAINTAIGALTGTPPAAAQIATLTPNINTFNS